MLIRLEVHRLMELPQIFCEVKNVMQTNPKWHNHMDLDPMASYVPVQAEELMDIIFVLKDHQLASLTVQG